jgi:hypothetical protein
MSSLERTMVTRVSEFVGAMNDLTLKSDTSANVVQQHVGSFNAITAKALQELGELASQFSTHGRSLAEAVELLEKSNRRTEESVSTKRQTIEALVSTLDTRTDDFAQRLVRFSGLLDESLDAATSRAREIASVIAETSNTSVQTIEQQYELVRATSEEERRRTSETLNTLYEEATGQAHTMLHQSAERFAEIMQGLKQMSTEMQQELETTRAELRRGIFELPQETAESAAQMRRVIVDQIEALAELNRIVARHGRGLDASEPQPQRRAPEPAYAAGGRDAPRMVEGAPRMEPQRPMPMPPRADITGGAPMPPRRADSPSLTPAPGQGNGWLSELLTRASKPDAAGERPARHSLESLDSLSVDIARMIDHDAAAELWDRYKQGERNVFTRKLYTMQGQRAFDEIRRKYRSDREFMQTVDRYVAEFERLLDEVSRDDRGQVVARTYLTSETGKVYTMLAHAAGRFD